MIAFQALVAAAAMRQTALVYRGARAMAAIQAWDDAGHWLPEGWLIRVRRGARPTFTLRRLR